MGRSRSRRLAIGARLLGAAALLACCAGCSTTRLVRETDEEAARVLAAKREEVAAYRMSPVPGLARSETGAETRVVDLRACLVEAAAHNRDIQSQREALTKSALSLLTARQNYRVRFTGLGASTTYTHGSRTLDTTADAGLLRWLATGAQLSLSLTESIVRVFSGGGTSYQPGVTFSLFQPLLQGAGRRIATEDLISAERSVVYQIRSYLRYESDFSLSVARRYFDVLLARDNLNNIRNNERFLRDTANRLQELAKEGRVKAFEADQARQDAYRAEQNRVEAENRQRTLEDEFKIFLGSRPGTLFAFDSTLLERLLAAGIEDTPRHLPTAVERALERRLDLMTTYDRVDDADRQVALARDALRTRLDLSGSLSGSGASASRFSLDVDSWDWSAGLALDLPVGKLSEAVAYRNALIAQDAARRDFVLKREQVELDVINSAASAREAYLSYGSQKNSLVLADRRKDNTNLLLELDRATTRDLLDAEAAYLSARTGVARSLVDYLMASLAFLQSCEMVELDEHGVWKGDIYEKVTGQTPW